MTNKTKPRRVAFGSSVDNALDDEARAERDASATAVFNTGKRSAFPKRRRAKKAYTTDRADKRAEIAAGVAAYDARVAAQGPLKRPPPLTHLPERASAGARELAREKRAGEYDATRTPWPVGPGRRKADT